MTSHVSKNTLAHFCPVSIQGLEVIRSRLRRRSLLCSLRYLCRKNKSTQILLPTWGQWQVGYCGEQGTVDSFANKERNYLRELKNAISKAANSAVASSAMVEKELQAWGSHKSLLQTQQLSCSSWSLRRKRVCPAKVNNPGQSINVAERISQSMLKSRDLQSDSRELQRHESVFLL